MNNNGILMRVLIGIFLILLGVGFLADQLGINYFGFNVFNLWPLMFVVISISMFSKRNMVAGIIFLTLGLAFLSANFLGYSIFAVIWPLIIIAIGVAMVFRPSRGWKSENWSSKGSTYTADHINESIVFSEIDRKIISDNFQGGKVEAVFGAMHLDLREVKFTNNAKLEVNCVFGSGEIILPKDIRVETKGSSAFGAWNNTFTASGDSDTPLLTLTGSAVFGEVTVHN